MIILLIAYELLRTLNGHGSWVESVAFDSNNIVAIGSWDRFFKIKIRD